MENVHGAWHVRDFSSAAIPEQLEIIADETPKVDIDGYRAASKESGLFEATIKTFGGIARIFLTAFALFWNGFLVFWYTIAFSMDDVPIMMVLFPLIHVAVGIGIGWTALVGWFNRSRVALENNVLKTTHGPFWVPSQRNLEVLLSEVEFFSSKEKKRRNSARQTPVRFFDLVVHLRSGEIQNVARGLSEESATFLERRLNKHLEGA